jgi:hypothetical protein
MIILMNMGCFTAEIMFYSQKESSRLGMGQHNDNNGNAYSDVFWLASVIESVGSLEFGQQVRVFQIPFSSPDTDIHYVCSVNCSD